MPKWDFLDWMWQPSAAPLHIGAGAAVLVTAAAYAYWRSFRQAPKANIALLLMRLAVIGALVILLFGPSKELPPATDQARTRLRIMFDTSASMQTRDCRSNTRFEFARQQWLNDDFLRQLRQHHDVTLQHFSDRLRPLTRYELDAEMDTVATGRATHLTEKVRESVTQMPAADRPGSMLVISDGHDTTESPIKSTAALAKSRSIPIFTVALGGKTLQRDISVVAVPMQNFLLPNEPGAILVKVFQVGLDDGQTKLRLRMGDQQTETKVRFDGQRMVEFQLPIQHEKEGYYEYSVDLEPLPGEVEHGNNQQTVFCEVEQRRLRVLLLEGQPYWDTKFLAQSLRKDERIQLTQITQVSRKKRETIVSRAEDEHVAAVPDTPQAWQSYDVVILGRGLQNILDADTARQLTKYVVEGGGNIIFARGPSLDATDDADADLHSHLAILEPVVWAVGEDLNMPVNLTSSGRTAPFLSATKMGMQIEDVFAQLPGLESMPLIERTKSSAIILAQTVDSEDENVRPALTVMRAGRGRVVSLLGQGSWRWSLLSPEAQDLIGFYDTFWSNLVRWLIMGSDFRPGQQVTLRLSRTSARLEDPVIVDVALKRIPTGQSGLQLSIKQPSGTTHQTSLSRIAGNELRYRTSVPTKSLGVYEVTLTTPDLEPNVQTQKFNVYDINLERLETSASPQTLRLLAEQSGGQPLDIDKPQQLIELLGRKRIALLSPPELVYIWDRGVILFLLVTLAGAEWILRRLAGLL